MYKAFIGNKEYLVESGSGKNTINGKQVDTDIVEIKNGRFHILRNNRSFSAEIIATNFSEKIFTVKINNSVYEVNVKDKYDELLHDLGLDKLNTKQAGDVKAPMPGLVVNVMVKPGQKIQKGDAIVILEAMKMENILNATSDGEVKHIHVKKGDKVEKNQVMVHLV